MPILKVKKNNRITVFLFITLLALLFVFSSFFIQNETIRLSFIYYSLLFPTVFLGLMLYEIVSIEFFAIIYYFLFLGLGGGILLLENLATYNVICICIVPLYLIILGTKIVPKKMKNRSPNSHIHFNLFSRKDVIFILYSISTLAGLYFVIKYSRFVSSNLAENRVNVMSGNGLLMLLLRLPIFLVPMMINLYYDYKKYRINSLFINKYSILICLLLSAFILLLTGYRTRFLMLILFSFLVFSKNKKIPLKYYVYFAVLILVLVFAYGALRDSNSIWRQIRTELIRNVINLNYIFNFFPKYVNFQHGYTYLIDFIMLKPGPDLDFTMWLKETLMLSFSGGGVTPTLMGELYMNFGFASIFIGSFLYGVTIKIIDNNYKEKRSIFYIFLCWDMAAALAGGLSNVLVDFAMFGFISYVINSFPTFVSLRRKKIVYENC